MSQGQSLGHGLNRQDGREMTPLDDLLNAVFSEDQLLRAVLSKPRSGELPRKVTVEPVELRGEIAFQFAAQQSDRVTHENLAPDDARQRLGLLLADYGQGLLQTAVADWQVLGAERLEAFADQSVVSSRGHDRRKRVSARGGRPGSISRRARRDDARGSGAEESLRQVPPDQPLPRACRRRRSRAPLRRDASGSSTSAAESPT